MSATSAHSLLDTIDMPPAVARLKRDHRGYPVPWFVAWIDGKPEFRVVRPNGVDTAALDQRCWICGGRIVGKRAYVVGPMCAVNRTSAEPPSHRACATYAARVCPFLTKPAMRRREAGMPEGTVPPAGTAIKRNPGVALVWVVRPPLHARRVEGGILFDLTGPEAVEWWCEGREATRAEVLHSIDTGLPILHAAAEEDDAAGRGRSSAVEALAAMHERALRLVPT